MPDEPELEIEDPSGLTDADWAEINNLKRAYRDGGQVALSGVIAELSKDPVRYIRIMGAIFPSMIREAIKDTMAESGITEEDMRDLIRKFESPARKQ